MIRVEPSKFDRGSVNVQTTSLSGQVLMNSMSQSVGKLGRGEYRLLDKRVLLMASLYDATMI